MLKAPSKYLNIYIKFSIFARQRTLQGAVSKSARKLDSFLGAPYNFLAAVGFYAVDRSQEKGGISP
jgi:hypothetical protein